MTNLEIILVDDGSTDDSGKICDEYAKKDDRIKVIHKKNAGVSAARNTGIINAAGEYIAFVDADDMAAENMCADAYEIAKCGNYDAVMFDTYIVRENNKASEIDSIDLLSESTELTKKDFYPMLLRYMAGTVWRCIYKREFLLENNILFPTELPLSEDRIFNIISFACCKKMYYLKKPLYYYNAIGESAVRSYRENYFDIAVDTNRIMKDILNKYWDNEYILLYNKINVIDGAKTAIYSICNSFNNLNKAEKLHKIHDIVDSKALAEVMQQYQPVDIRESLIANKKYYSIYFYERWIHRLGSSVKRMIKSKLR